MQKKNIELLAPAGSAAAFKAALVAGADAIFFGLEHFNARVRADNITMKELSELTQLASSLGVRSYLTLNTLILDSEMTRAVNLAAEALHNGVDAVIVQDWGLLSLLRECIPGVEIHASTQLTTHNNAQCDLLASLGCSQINLSRELALRELDHICTHCNALGVAPEVFVHGAYCISFSGQCAMSNALYGEAGNRGACVQPCRREFTNAKGETVRPFNLKDNSAFAFAESLINAGAKSLKIEGRIKNADYVWAVTSAWRSQLDALLQGLPPQADAPVLKLAFNRDLTDGYLRGEISGDMFTQGAKDQSLVANGTVVSYHADSRELIIEGGLLTAGDQLTIQERDGVFVCTGEILAEIGTGQYRFKITNKLAGKISRGQRVYKKPTLIEADALAALTAGLKPVEKTIMVTVTGMAGKPLTVRYCADGVDATATSHSVLSPALNRSLTKEVLRDQLGRLGGTGFALGEIDTRELETGLFLPLKELNEMRRECMAPFTTEEHPFVPVSLPSLEKSVSVSHDFPVYWCDSLALAKQLVALKEVVLFDVSLSPDDSVVDFLAHHELVIPAFSAILFEDDFIRAETVMQRVASSKIYTDNSGLALRAKEMGKEVILGAHLNCTNSWSLHLLADELNAATIIPSREISPAQVATLSVPAGTSLWYPLYEHEFLMQSRHCLVRNAVGCNKLTVDRECIDNCNKRSSFKGTQGEKIKAVKRPGFYGALYRERIVSNLEAMAQLSGHVEGWIIDLRNLGDQEFTLEEITVLCKKGDDLITNKKGLELFKEFSRRKFFLKEYV